MRDIGFSLVSTHAGAGDIAKNGDKIIADAKALGLKYVVCSSPGVSPEKEKLPWEERMKAVDLTDWKWNADLFNKFGKQVSDAGMTFGYHNHSAEFKKFDGQTAFDYLFGMTDAKHVKIELDVGWVAVAEQDPIAILEQVQGPRDRAARQGRGEARAPTARIRRPWRWAKAWSTGRRCIGTAKANGTKAFFYEQEAPFTRPILDSVKISGDYLTKLAI